MSRGHASPEPHHSHRHGLPHAPMRVREHHVLIRAGYAPPVSVTSPGQIRKPGLALEHQLAQTLELQPTELIESVRANDRAVWHRVIVSRLTSRLASPRRGSPSTRFTVGSRSGGQVSKRTSRAVASSTAKRKSRSPSKAIASRSDAMASRLDAKVSHLDAIASRLDTGVNGST